MNKMLVVTLIKNKKYETNYSFCISTEKIFDLSVKAERIKGKCCSHTEYEEIQIGNSEFEFDSEKGIYKIQFE